jgi:hypothetical protein
VVVRALLADETMFSDREPIFAREDDPDTSVSPRRSSSSRILSI